MAVSRLDRLFILLDTGTTPVTRKAAAQQLGEVVKLHPHELNNLLSKVLTYLRSPNWDTRIAAGQAVEAIVKNIPEWDPSPKPKEESCEDLSPEDSPCDRLTFYHFDISRLLKHGASLLGSAGAEFELQDEKTGWTVCSRCETYRPPRAHHCRVCQRCIRRMDHHCPWINNCVGELNQKYFIQFLFYTGMASLYSMVLVVSAWVWRIRNEREGDAEKEGEETPSKHLIVAHYIILLVESVLFGVFVMVIFYDQLVSIITDETPIEQMRNRLMIKDRGSSSSSLSSTSPSQPPHHPPHTRKPKLALLREVFGRGSVFCWLLPLHSSPPSVGGITYSALPDYDV